jgi:hypothetical protein
MWAVVVLLFIGPFLEVGNSIGGMTGKMNGSWSQTVDIGRDLLWLVFDVVILLPLAIVVNVVATRNRRRKVVVAQRAAAARNSKKKDR